MKTTSQKLNSLKEKISRNEKITIAIFGLGSVGNYLLDYLVSLSDPQLRMVVVGRNKEKLQMDVNIVRTAACIRRQLSSEIVVEGNCDFTDVDAICKVLENYRPDFIVNSSRFFSGLKYGSISWKNLRSYGIWSPLSVVLAKNIMKAYGKAGSQAISLNTSYSDVVIPWLKSAGLPCFDFGSGNLNHLIPRMKFHIAEKYNIRDLNEIDITLAVSHFHDVVISKEGQPEGQDILLDIRYRGKPLAYDKSELLKACAIAMPVDQKRNMMNASSNFEIICALLSAIRQKRKIKIHSPGVDGRIGGYPYMIDAEKDEIRDYVDTSVFSLEVMECANRQSIYLDGIEDVRDGSLFYTDELLKKVKDRFNMNLPKQVHLSEAEYVARLLIDGLIRPNIN